MTAGTLVVGPVGTSSSLEGAQLLESLAELSEALRSESWLDAALSGVGVVLDAAAAALDPIGSLISAGLGWLMEHLEPLKGWLTDLTGDAGAVLGFAATWDNIAAELDLAAGDYGRVLRVDLGAMQGEAVGAYVRHGDGVVAQLRGLSGGSGAVAAALRTASGVVQTVRELVRDALADLVGSAISWVLQSVATAGLGTPWVVAQVATRVSSLVARVGGKVTALVGSMSSLRGLVDELGGVLAGLAGVAAKPRGGEVGAPAAVAYTGGRLRPRPTNLILEFDWAERAYAVLRADRELAQDIVANYSSYSSEDVVRAIRHVLVDDHLLGTSHGEQYVGRFAPDADMAEALMRLRSGGAVATDHILLRHEIAESAYCALHPGATYEEGHAYANGVADWNAAMKEA